MYEFCYWGFHEIREFMKKNNFAFVNGKLQV